MLLIVSNSTDATADFAEREIALGGQPYCRLDTDLYPHETRVDLRRDTALRSGSAGTIDLVLDEQGQIWFLEVNPNGQWAWLEEATGEPIAASLARLFRHYG